MADNPWVDMATARKQSTEQAATTNSTGTRPTAASDTRPVVTGYANYQSGGYSGIPVSGNRVPQTSTVFDARGTLSQLRATAPAQYNALLGQMRAAGYLGERAESMSSIEAAWNTVLEDSAALYANKPDAKNLSVWDFLYGKASKGAATAAKNDSDGPGSGPRGGGSQAFTNTTVQFSNEFDARALVDNALNQYLGRDARPQERAKFLAMLNQTEAANPQVDSGVSGPSGTSRATSGGVGAAGAGLMAEDFAKSRGDYAETQASTTLLSRMEKLIMGDTTGSM